MSIDLIDPVENLAVRMMKEAADKTATSAGDGTTTAIVLTEALVLAGLDAMSNQKKMNMTEVLRQLNSLTNNVVSELKGKSKKLNKKMLLDVATISANNDPDTGYIISEVYKEVG